MHACVLGGAYLHAQVDHLSKFTVSAENPPPKKNQTNIILTCGHLGIHMTGRDIFGLKSSISQKLIPQAGTVDKWVPADGGKMHLGYDHTAARYSCQSKAEVRT